MERTMTFETQKRRRKRAAIDWDTVMACMDLKGYVILGDVFRKKQLQDMHDLAREKTAGEPSTQGRMQLPITDQVVDSGIVDNPDLLRVVEGLLGDSCTLRTIRVDTGKQEHSDEIVMDSTSLFPEATQTHLPCYRLHVTIPLASLKVNQNWLEIWPGSHAHQPHYFRKYGMDCMQRLAERLPTEAVNVPFGSVLIRDSRLWYRDPHAVPRMNLELTYQRWWDITGEQQIIAESLYRQMTPRLQRLLYMEKVVEEGMYVHEVDGR
ncbi:hypothetical protein HUB94_04250 [Paenibacillus cellulosilyticus]|nr:hypothetical protein HUB94_04250 [Paenibacillus cellulosilyticus]